jgi:hypothetical protein
MKKRLILLGKGLAGTTVALLGLGMVFAPPAAAIFGLGDIVFDPTTYATMGEIWSEDVSTGQKILQEIAQMEKIYANGVQVYNLAHAMSQSFDGQHKAEWLTLAQMGVADYTTDKYGENSTWAKTLNGNPGLAQSAWSAATVPFSHGTFLSGETLGNSSLLAHLSSLEAMDGSSVKCLSTISQYRANSMLNLAPILKLAIAHADGSADTNSNIEQLNLLNAHNQQGNTEQQAQGTVNACLVEQQILANKIQRDQIATHLDFIGKTANYDAAEGNGWGGAAEALAR